MDVHELAARCSQETAQSRQRQLADDRYCFELFRRAIVLREDVAWNALMAQYGRLVRSWLDVRGPDAEALVNDTFARFWQQISPDRFQHGFHHLGGVLGYLRKCARSAAIARWRQEKQQEKLAMLLRDRHKGSSERDPLLDFNAPELVAYVKARLDEREWRVIELSIIYGLKPRQIHAQHPDEFTSPHEVSHIKERGLERLRRDPYLRRLWGEVE
jgi:DNA-directed RNA polymerase specialized sigma24 family protein